MGAEIAETIREHVNDERDVLYAVFEGRARLSVDGEPAELESGDAAIVAKGSRRSLVAGPDGVRYLTAHVRRGGLQIRGRRAS